METLVQRIQKTPGICGGDARIRDTRISVAWLIECKQHGRADRQLLESYPPLLPKDLEAAWQYYDDHRAEIDTAIQHQIQAEHGNSGVES